MRKFVVLFALCIACFCDDFHKNSDDNLTFETILSNINDINAQILIMKSKAVDDNTTLDNALYESVLAKKNKLLEQVPYMIMQIKITDMQIDNIKSQRASLQKLVANLKNSNKQEYVKNAVKLEKFELDELFFTSIMNLAQIFKDGGKTKQIKTSVEETLLGLQTQFYSDNKNLKDSISPELFAHFKDEFARLDLYKDSLEEVLNYLRNNANLLNSNFVLSELNLSTAIDIINSKIPSNSGINFGKILIILAIFLFFISFTTILSKTIYMILVKFFVKHSQDAHTKGKVVRIISRPMLSILSVYAIEICVLVAYYPVPMPINVSNIFSILFVVAFAWLILGMLDGYGMVLISELTRKSGRKEVINLILKIVYFIIITITLLIVLSHLGFNVSAIIASLGIGGLAIALATKDILANFFASVMLLFDNSFSQGDWIVCGDIEGTVVEIGLRKTTIRTFDNALIFVPNSKLASDPIRNWSRRRLGRRIRMVIGVEYGSKIEQLKKCVDDIKNMLATHPEIATSSDMGSKKISQYRQNIVSIDDLAGYKSNLFVVIDELGESSVNILVYCFSKTIVWGDFLAVKQDVILKIVKIVQDNGLNFAYPSQSLYIENVKDMKI